MASSSSSSNVRKYDVFLSFRGEDTRRTIVSYLYQALRRDGIFTFKDDQRLQIGDNISEELIKAIQTSWFAVVVISENYATSKWCLEELRLIMELLSEDRIRVVPIFYGVQPTDVRHQTGSFEAAFQYEQLGTAPERVTQWRRALNQISHLIGFNSSTWADEAAMVSDTVRSISRQLLDMRQPSGVDLVGMEAHMMKMHFLMNKKGSEDEVLMIGIWGMGGIGKSTIAKCLYDRVSRQFPAHYFLEDIKKIYKNKSPSQLQERFLSTILPGQHIDFLSNEAGFEIKARLGHQKVLLVLDGVDKAEQVHALARDRSWFGSGSRIIITTRDRGLLNYSGVNSVHEVKCLDDKDALQVFQKFAFGGRPPPDGFQQLFIRASQLAHGLPSAIVAYASYLSENDTIKSWDDKLGILETRPHKNVEEILRYSYDGLDDQDKIAFLQVACLFNGYPFNHVTSLLDKGRPKINHLTAKSLITITTDGCINMHALVIQTGKAIVRQESRYMPSRQRFLWDHMDIYDILNRNVVTDEVEGLALNMCEMTDKLHLSRTVFDVRHSIKFLKFFQNLRDAESNVQLGRDGFSFPRNIRLLHWDAYPLQTLSLSRGYRHLVQLNLRYSNLKRLWDRSVNLQSLLRLDVTGSKNLTELPDFSTAEKLEELIVEGCLRLRRISGSLGSFVRLKKLNAVNCNTFWEVRLRVYWSTWESHCRTIIMSQDEDMLFYSLTDLSIDGQMYVELEHLSGKAEHLSFGSNQQIPDQMMTYPNSLKSLEIKRFNNMQNGNYFRCFSFQNYPYLTELKLINLNIEDIPEDISHLQFLETLDLSGNNLEHLTTTMGQLAKLKYLSLRNCPYLRELPRLAQVEMLILSDCTKLRRLVEPFVEEARDTYCLVELWLDNCNEVQILSHQLRSFTKLTYLDLSRNDFVSVPESIRELSSLETLFLNKCRYLRSLEDLPQSLIYLYAHGCESLENVSLPPNHTIKHLDLSNCPLLNREEQDNQEEISQEDLRPSASLPETGESSESDHKPTVTSTKTNRTRKFFRSLKAVFTKSFSRFH